VVLKEKARQARAHRAFMSWQTQFSTDPIRRLTEFTD